MPESEWPEFSRVAARALQRAGLQRIDDQNDSFEPGYFPIAINNEHDRRVSTAAGYLDADVRSRPNLTILADTEVRRILFDGTRVSGVEVRNAGWLDRHAFGRRGRCRGRRAPYPCAAAPIRNRPRSAAFSSLGIEVIVDLPGVGENLQEHPQIAVTALLEPDARQPWEQRRHIFAGFRYSSGIDGCDDVDMYGVVVNRGAWHPLGQKLGGFLIWVNKAYSTGRVSLVSADPAIEPRVEFGFLSDERDLHRLADGLRRLAEIYRDPDMQAIAFYPFATSYTERSRDLAIVTAENEALLRPIAELLDDESDRSAGAS